MEAIEWIQKLFTDYGAVNVIIMFLVIILTNIIKRPIVNKAENFVESAKKLTGLDVDKSVITSFISLIPIGLSLVFYFLYGCIQVKFHMSELDISQILSNAVIYGFLSISIFETAKGFIKAYLSKKSDNEAKKSLQNQVKESNEQDMENDLLTSSEPEKVDSEVLEETTTNLEE